MVLENWIHSATIEVFGNESHDYMVQYSLRSRLHVQCRIVPMFRRIDVPLDRWQIMLKRYF